MAAVAVAGSARAAAGAAARLRARAAALLRYGRFARDGAVPALPASTTRVELAAGRLPAAARWAARCATRRPSSAQLALLLERAERRRSREASLLLPDAWLRVGFTESRRAAARRGGARRGAALEAQAPGALPRRGAARRRRSRSSRCPARRSRAGCSSASRSSSARAARGGVRRPRRRDRVRLQRRAWRCSRRCGRRPSPELARRAAGRRRRLRAGLRPRGRPLLHRFKAWNGALARGGARRAGRARPAADRELPRREPAGHGGRAALPFRAGAPRGGVAGARSAAGWAPAPPSAATPLRPEHLRLAGGDAPPAWREAAPLLGAVCQEVR